LRRPPGLARDALGRPQRGLLPLNRVGQSDEIFQRALVAAADDGALLALEREPQRRKLAKRDRIGRAELGDNRKDDVLVAPPVARATVDARKKARIVCEPRSELRRSIVGNGETLRPNPLETPRKLIPVVPTLSA
jgi:hypothetical protein